MDVRRPLLACLVLIACLGAAPGTEARRSVPKGFYGVVWAEAPTRAAAAAQDAQWALMARSGVETTRATFSWAQAQPVAGQPPNFAESDALVAMAARHGLRLLPVVLYAPEWAKAVPGRGASPPARPADYAAYLRLLVRRYGPQGSFWSEHPELPRLPVRDWQFWNEPHLRKYWNERPWAPGYTRLLREGYRAVKAEDPGARVVLAGLADFVWRHLRSLYRAGARGSFDVMAMNFFTSRPDLVLKGVRYVRRVLRRGREPRKPIWITEVTWPSSRGRASGVRRQSWQRAWETTDRGMATRLTRFYRLAARNRRSLRIGRVYWFTWASPYSRPGSLFDFSGLLGVDGDTFTPRPALAAYSASARRHQGR